MLAFDGGQGGDYQTILYINKVSNLFLLALL